MTGADTNGDTHFEDRLFIIGRNTGVGPNYRSFDLRLSKVFRLGSEGLARVEFLVEAQNIFNRANFATVNGVLGADPFASDYNTGTFRLKGRSDRGLTQPLGFASAFDPRHVQFGLKFKF
jgi:hypothetical protein